MNTFTLAWKNAEFGVNRFGGKKADYFKSALELAKKGIDLQAIAREENKKAFFTLLMITILTVLCVGFAYVASPLLSELFKCLQVFKPLAVFNGLAVTLIAMVNFSVFNNMKGAA